MTAAVTRGNMPIERLSEQLIRSTAPRQNITFFLYENIGLCSIKKMRNNIIFSSELHRKCVYPRRETRGTTTNLLSSKGTALRTSWRRRCCGWGLPSTGVGGSLLLGTAGDCSEAGVYIWKYELGKEEKWQRNEMGRKHLQGNNCDGGASSIRRRNLEGIRTGGSVLMTFGGEFLRKI